METGPRERLLAQRTEEQRDGGDGLVDTVESRPSDDAAAGGVAAGSPVVNKLTGEASDGGRERGADRDGPGGEMGGEEGEREREGDGDGDVEGEDTEGGATRDSQKETEAGDEEADKDGGVGTGGDVDVDVDAAPTDGVVGTQTGVANVSSAAGQPVQSWPTVSVDVGVVAIFRGESQYLAEWLASPTTATRRQTRRPRRCCSRSSTLAW
jgi:hypothetical protein